MMETYTAEGPFHVRAGVVVLTDEQALWRLRTSVIEATENHGVYNVIGRVQFKKGESFGWDGDPPKMSRNFLRLVPGEREEGSGETE